MDNASTPALKAQRELFRYLDLHFVDGAYTDDYTDEKLAKELGLSAKFVTNVREEAYGKFAVPQGLIDLAKEVGEAQAMINEMNRDVLNPLAKRVNDAMKAYG